MPSQASGYSIGYLDSQPFSFSRSLIFTSPTSLSGTSAMAKTQSLSARATCVPDCKRWTRTRNWFGISDRTSFTFCTNQLSANCLNRKLKFQSTTPTPSVKSPTPSKGSAYHGSRRWAKATRGIYQRKKRLHAAAKHKCCLWIQFFIFTIWHAKHLVFPLRIHVMVHTHTYIYMYTYAMCGYIYIYIYTLLILYFIIHITILRTI